MQLPTKPSPARRKNPAQIVIFGKPKCGKTTVSADLTKDGSWLLLELETNGADYVEATMVEASNLKQIQEIGSAIKEAGNPYKGVIVDTVTKLEEMVMPLACDLYRKTPMGATWQGNDVRVLPKGAGYLYLRQAFFQVIDYIKTWAHNVIFIGHLSDKMIEKEGEELNAKELDLTGKISKLMCADMDAIAYCYRDENTTVLNFESSEEVLCGSRCEHLRGKKIVIADSDESGKLTTYWDKVYLAE
jgi:hypothetical protein